MLFLKNTNKKNTTMLKKITIPHCPNWLVGRQFNKKQPQKNLNQIESFCLVRSLPHKSVFSIKTSF